MFLHVVQFILVRVAQAFIVVIVVLIATLAFVIHCLHILGVSPHDSNGQRVVRNLERLDVEVVCGRVVLYRYFIWVYQLAMFSSAYIARKRTSLSLEVKLQAGRPGYWKGVIYAVEVLRIELARPATAVEAAEVLIVIAR